MPDEPILVFPHPEEVVALLAEFGNRFVLRALPVDELLLHVEPLAAEAVKPLVLAEVDIAGVIDLPEDPTDRLHMVCVGRPDEVIVCDRKLRPKGAKLSADPVGILLGGDARLLGRLGDLVSVLVRSGDEKGPAAAQPMVARQNVGNDRRIGVPEVGRGVHIVDGCRNVISAFHNLPFYPNDAPTVSIKKTARCSEIASRKRALEIFRAP